MPEIINLNRDMHHAPRNGAEKLQIHRLRYAIVLPAALCILAILIALSLSLGARLIPFEDLWSAVFTPNPQDAASIVVWDQRFPRTLLAILVGAALGVAGALMQIVTRNPLAEPGLLGVNAGASLFVVLSISLLGITTMAGRIGFALAGAAAAALLVTWLGTRGPARDLTHLVLAGLALSASLSAIVGIITMFNSTTFDSYRFWMVGALSAADPTMVLVLAPAVLLALALSVALGRHFNVLALGDDLGTGLGVKVKTMRITALALLTVLCGSAVAAAGPIGFVGLMVPHAVRLLIGVDQRAVLWLSLLIGPIVVLSADIIGRLVLRPGELETGIVTAFIGAPVLLSLILRLKGALR